jgi:hypothetical protein
MDELRTPKIAFSNRPDDHDQRNQYQIVRTPAKQPLQMLCLSADCLGVYTHFWRNATRPCFDQDCEACDAGIGRRWHGYLGVQGIKSGDIAIFEFTAPCCDALDEYIRTHSTLRGGKIIATRASQRENGRVRLQIVQSFKTEIEIPATPDVPRFLRKLWDMPRPQDVTSTVAPGPEQDAFDKFQSALNGQGGNGSVKHDRLNGRFDYGAD